MDTATAEKLMDIYSKMGELMNEADGIVRGLPESERRVHLEALGSAMTDLWMRLQLPIVREHQHLDPDHLSPLEHKC